MTVYDSGGGTIYGTSTSTAELCPGVRPSQMIAHVSLQQAARTGYLNVAAFCNQPVIGTASTLDGFIPMAPGTDFGNSPIGAVLGPGQFNWDAALQKNFNITERQKFEFRAEFYNFPNHTQFNLPVTESFPQVTLSRLPTGAISPNGQTPISSTSVNPRLIQFGLKYKF